MSGEQEHPAAGAANADGAAGDGALSVELRALYEQFARAESIGERQAIWNAIVAHHRSGEERVGTAAERTREAVVEHHQRRRLWPF
jgi:hypothetical protein